MGLQALSPHDGVRPIATNTLPAKAKALAVLNAGSLATGTGMNTPAEGGSDLAEQLNEQVRKQFVTGKTVFSFGIYAIAIIKLWQELKSMAD